MKTTLPRRLGVVAAAVPLVLGFAACGHSTEHASISAVAVAGGNGWSTPTITGDKKDKIVITVGNTTNETHGFSIEGYPKVVKTVAPGQTISVKVPLTQGGTFKIFCQLHKAHQTATLIVQ